MRNRGARQRLAARLIADVLVVLALAGCAQAPVPHAALASAEMAVARARALAEQALVDAELAEVEAQAAQAEADARRLRQHVGQQHRRVAPGGDDA